MTRSGCREGVDKDVGSCSDGEAEGTMGRQGGVGVSGQGVIGGDGGRSENGLNGAHEGDGQGQAEGPGH